MNVKQKYVNVNTKLTFFVKGKDHLNYIRRLSSHLPEKECVCFVLSNEGNWCYLTFLCFMKNNRDTINQRNYLLLEKQYLPL